MNPLANSLGNSLAQPPPSSRSAQTTPRTSLDMLRNASTPNSSSPISSHSTHSAHSTGPNTSPSTSFSLSTVNPPSPPTSKPFHRNPSIRVQKDKTVKDKDKEKDKDRKREDDTKIALKRSRSPIKLIKNIKSYLHVHKHKGSSGNNVIQGNPGSPGYYISNLAPSNSGDSHNYRNTALPSSSILSPGPSSGQGLPRPRDRQPSESLDPERQVLLLRVISYFEHAGHRADEETAEYLLSSYQWDINLTLQYCQDLVEAVHGTLLPIHQETHLSGAVNDQMTSCYIDALLFAMFARLTAFEGLLSVNLDGDSDSDSDGSGKAIEPKSITEKQEILLSTHRLQTWLRMFVNQLRSGKLIQAHVVKELRQHLYCCGWHCPGPMDPPGSSRQEDASELFMFLTEKLHLPYLPLEQRLLHGAKISDDDDKVITERMLQISIPTPEVPPLPLSPDALKPPKESTFSKFLGQKPSPHSKNGSANGNKADSPTSTLHDILSLETLLAQHFYDNTLTGIRRKVSAGTGIPLSPGVEVPVSAWQVLELLPFYSSSNEQGGEIYASQSQYPSDVVILPLILKRYSIGPDMRPRRIGTPIDIPRRIDFSSFVNPQTPGAGKKTAKASDATGVGGPPPPTSLDPSHTPHFPVPSAGGPASTRDRSSSSASRLSQSNVATLGASSSMHDTSGSSSTPPPLPMKINTQVTPPSRKYSMSLLQAATTGSGMPESPMMTPGTPPPVYTPSHAKQFLEFTDDKKSWAHPPDRTGRDYMDCHPRVKYMLELKSVVCHLGSQLNSGHYRSYAADVVEKPSSSSLLPPQEPNWLRHDDLDPSGHRVHLIQRDTVENMDMESDWARNGYILFYELQTIQLT